MILVREVENTGAVLFIVILKTAEDDDRSGRVPITFIKYIPTGLGLESEIVPFDGLTLIWSVS